MSFLHWHYQKQRNKIERTLNHIRYLFLRSNFLLVFYYHVIYNEDGNVFLSISYQSFMITYHDFHFQNDRNNFIDFSL